MVDMILRGGLVMTPGGPEEADVAIAGGVVATVGRDLAGEDIVDCDGSWVGPGFVDIHAHFREPGQTWKEDIESGSAAAAVGGYTGVVTMPNTDPPIDDGHLARYVADRGRQVGLVEIAAAGCVSLARAGEQLAHLDDLWNAGTRIFTDDGDTIADAGLMRRALEYLGPRGGVVAQHAVEPRLAAGGHMHEGAVSSRLGMYAIPSEAEAVVIGRDLALVRLTGAAYHVQHISTAEGVALIAAAKDEGLPVTAEVTPHHLMFDDSAVATTDPVFKMMPPLRSANDVAALHDALRSGIIDAVATDHAPHAEHEKDVPFEEAPFGVIGLEWAAAAVNDAVALGPWDFYDRLAVAPARIAGMERQGHWIREGAPANIAVFDPSRSWTPASTISRSTNSPYLGRELRGAVAMTIFRGEPTYAAAVGAGL
jgi:dihydroorotase